MKKLSFDSTPSVKGILFQFLIALERCFKMQKGQSVYIETYGDVSVLGDLNHSEQIESKFYKKALTDLDKNIWKSIYNWMNEDFPIDKFSSLVLFTTQTVSMTSSWLNWNVKPLVERKKILNKLKKQFDSQKKQSKDMAMYMNAIFDTKKATRLSQIVEILYIDTTRMDWNQYYKHIRDEYAKGIPNIQKGKYMNHMFGYILNPNIVNNSWRITYDDFTRETEEITKTLVENTAVFPTKLKLADIKKDDYDGYAFVEKIKDIEYENEVLSEAVNDYVHTASLIDQELSESLVIKNQLEEYEDAVERRYRNEYRKAARIFKREECIQRSQELYDNVTTANDGTFHTYNNVPPYFHNGVVQILANENDDIVWLLKESKNE